MVKKEKIRFAVAIVLFLIFAVCTFFIIEATVCEILMSPSQTTGNFYLVLSLWMEMIALALLIFIIGAVCAGALSAFFSFSFRNYEGNAVRRTMKTVFTADMILIIIDLLSLAIFFL